MYSRFGLTLMVTQACNLDCNYCYISGKSNNVMPLDLAKKAIDRAIVSISPGGCLELGLFGGEPFLEPDLLSEIIQYAEDTARDFDVKLTVNITTNGTILDQKSKNIMLSSNVDIAFSIDGDEQTHNENRKFADGTGSYEIVVGNYKRLRSFDKHIPVIVVVTPKNIDRLSDNVLSLQKIGCNNIELSLDLWAYWDNTAMDVLRQAVKDCSKLWLSGLPGKHISWFDDMTVRLSDAANKVRKCGFGKGDIAVTPNGNLYPCERLIDGDQPENPMKLKGNVFEGSDFLFGEPRDIRDVSTCKQCGIFSQCKTTCGCCNYIRSGSPGKPDLLLCLFNQWCLEETEKILKQIIME